MFLSIYMIMLDVFLRTLWHYDYRTLEYSTMMPFHWEYDHSGHIGLSYDLHGFSRSHRYLLQLACNCSPLVIKDTDYIGIFIVFVDSVISLLLIFLTTFSARISSEITGSLDPIFYSMKLHISGVCIPLSACWSRLPFWIYRPIQIFTF